MWRGDILYQQGIAQDVVELAVNINTYAMGNIYAGALSVIFGILLMVDGLHSAVHAWMYARRSGKKWWWVLLLLSLSLILAGIVILNNPWWHTAHSFVKVIGGVMLYGAAVGIVRLILVWPIQKK